MRKLSRILGLTLIIFLLTLVTLASAQAAKTDFNEEFFNKLADKVNEIPEIKTPAYEVLKLDNGMTFYLSQDKKLPIVEIRGYIEGGKVNENKENSGITSLMTELMVLKTENYQENELAEFKEINALTLDFGSSLDRINFTANSLKTHSDQLLRLLTEVLRKTDFKGKHFNRTVNEFKELYKQQFYNDSALLNMYFFKNLYGDHPYSYNYNYRLKLAALNDFSPQKLTDFYQKTINPQDIVVAISGDLDIAQMKKKLEQKFADWENNKGSQKPDYVWVDQDIHNKIIIVNKENATQANMRIGYNFYRSKYPKRIPFLMGNRIFGSGSFNSRLMEKLRSEKGYVYGVNAQTRYNDYGGAYYINLSLKPEKASAGVRAVRKEMEKIKNHTAEFTKEELFENINLYNTIFPRAYQEQINVLDKLVYEMEIYGEPESYINDFIAIYNGLDYQEVQKIFAEELYPEIIFTVIVGPKEEILPQFKDSGVEIEVIDLKDLR